MDTHAHGQNGDRKPLLRGVRGKSHANFAHTGSDYLRAALVGACALAGALAVLIFKQAADVRDLNARLSAVYQKAFYETCELMEGMSTNLRKLLVTGSAQQEQLLLSEIARQAQARRTTYRNCRWRRRGVGDDQVRQPGRGLRHLAGRASGGRRGHQRRGL